MSEHRPGLYDRFIASVPILARLQRWMINVGRRPAALNWLLFISFLESLVFPIPMDPLLAVVVIARPAQWVRLVLLTALTSVIGGVVGWWIGLTLGEAIIAMGWLGEEGAYATVREVFAKHGWLVLFVGAFTPFPYKIVVVSSGFLGYGLVPLVITSLVGRSLRFLLVAAIIRYRRDTRKAAVLTFVLAGLMAFFWWYIQR